MLIVKSKLSVGTRQSGFSMTEILITSLILAVGLLGLAAMQANALRGSLDSGQRGKAIWLTQELAERMRSNPDGISQNDYITASDNANLCAAAPARLCSDYYDQATGKKVTVANTCNAQQMATYDLWELRCGYTNKDENKSSLRDFMAVDNSSVLSVSCDADPCQSASTYTINSTWLGRGEGKANDAKNYNQSISLDFRP
ncbi:type IV pilus modification protein PilV [Litoribacillus peritrichatus]|uniref:Type IV pilin Tt1218-like domain-containing protein n=1 Tax=Litoribacillus peritrichatus TaxID=718191 RepID=A0ABP7MQT3_9GAMM